MPWPVDTNAGAPRMVLIRSFGCKDFGGGGGWAFGVWGFMARTRGLEVQGLPFPVFRASDLQVFRSFGLRGGSGCVKN